MVVIPGGAYAICSDREADAVAMAYLKAGYQAFILRYTLTGKGSWPYPLEDYEQAMELIGEKAEEWHIAVDKIAVVGFSAGGHLAACAATIAVHKPAAAVLAYPAIIKDIVDACQPGMPYPHEHVTHQTCPCFLVAARDDKIVDIENTLAFELALAKKGIAFESHIYSFGGHGFSTGDDWIVTSLVPPRLSSWVAESIQWLGEMLGKLTPGGFTDRQVKRTMNSDHELMLSVECSLGHLSKQKEEVKALLSSLFSALDTAAKTQGFSSEALFTALRSNTAREIMEMLHFPEAMISEIDASLHEMANEC